MEFTLDLLRQVHTDRTLCLVVDDDTDQLVPVPREQADREQRLVLMAWAPDDAASYTDAELEAAAVALNTYAIEVVDSEDPWLLGNLTIEPEG